MDGWPGGVLTGEGERSARRRLHVELMPQNQTRGRAAGPATTMPDPQSCPHAARPGAQQPPRHGRGGALGRAARPRRPHGAKPGRQRPWRCGPAREGCVLAGLPGAAHVMFTCGVTVSLCASQGGPQSCARQALPTSQHNTPVLTRRWIAEARATLQEG